MLLNNQQIDPNGNREDQRGRGEGAVNREHQQQQIAQGNQARDASRNI